MEKIRVEDSPLECKTDPTRWRLRSEDGRHTWHYLADSATAQAWAQTDADKYFLGLPLGSSALPRATSPLAAAENGLAFIEGIQLSSGHWGGDSGGPLTFCAGIVIAWYATGTPIPGPVATELTKYLVARVNPEDGGWGLHTTGESNVCGTAINYIVLRLLGMDAHHPVAMKARTFLIKHGGAVYSSTWGKVWMAVLGIVHWDAVHPIPPEAWLLPDWVPFAPWRFYAEMRIVSQPLSYIYSKKWSCQETELIREIRREVLVQPFSEIRWKFHRNTVSKVDAKASRSWIMSSLSWAYLNIWEPYMRTESLKSKAEFWVSQLIDMQDANTNYVGIAATDAPLNTIICYFRDGPDSISYKTHIKRLQEFLWMSKDGMLINSTNGSQSWDTAFYLQGICAAGLHKEERGRDMVLKAFRFLDNQQIRENCVDQKRCYRQQRIGCWTFSNRHQGFAVSDCTAEALKAVILLQKTPGFPQLLDDQRIFDAVDSMILYQNATGGVSAFEARRGGEFLELLNPTEIFGRMMVDYDYPECTASCVTALALFKTYWPRYRTVDVNKFIRRGTDWIKSDQRADGSWFGSWGICFTYATMFALEALAVVGEVYHNSEGSRRGCNFLISKQRDDGGWSESFKALETKKYCEDPQGSLTVQTSWAIIGLMQAEFPEMEPILRGVQFLISQQQDNGEWLEQAIAGSFHDFSTFSYPNYKFAFTIKALGLVATKYPEVQFFLGKA